MKEKKYTLKHKEKGYPSDVEFTIKENKALIFFDSLSQDFIYLYPKQLKQLLDILEKTETIRFMKEYY